MTLTTRASDCILYQIAKFMLNLSQKATTRSVVLFWHCEPEMPQSMLDEFMYSEEE